MIPWTDTPKPLYKPMAPSDLNVLARQLPRPENSLSPAPLPTSAANLKKEKMAFNEVWEVNNE